MKAERPGQLANPGYWATVDEWERRGGWDICGENGDIRGLLTQLEMAGQSTRTEVSNLFL